MQYRVEAETDRLRVIRVRYEPGERSPQHRHPALPQETVHALENVGAAPFEALRIEVLPPRT